MKKNISRILFICPKFYNYEIEILEELGYYSKNIDFVFYSNKKHWFFWKNRKVKKQLNRCLKSYNDYINNYRYDMLFVIKGEILYEKDIKLFKKLNPLSKTIIFQWDSLDNLPFNFNFIESFDFRYTFDYKDSQNYMKYNLRPLFFTKHFKHKNFSNFDYEFSTIASFNYRRVKIISYLTKLFPDQKFKVLLRTFLTFNLFKNLFKTGFKRYFEYSLFRDMKKSEISEILNKSKVIIDIPSKEQTGISMRVIESLGLQKKIITTCKFVKNYDFYNPNNMLVLNKNGKKEILDFIQKPYIKLEKKLINKYKLKSFINTVLFQVDENYFK